jgi:hypothetical protein
MFGHGGLSKDRTGYPSPDRSDEGEPMNVFPDDVGAEIEAYAAYLNAPRGILDSDEQILFDQDLLKARAAMERAWLEAKPARERQ